MSTLNNITSKIISEGEEKKKEILSSANEESAKILEKRKKEAESIAEGIINKAKLEASTKKERIISNALLQIRNDKLGAKQKVVEKVFNKALDDLSRLPKEDFIKYLSCSVFSLEVEGTYNLILNESGNSMINSNDIVELNLELAKENKKYKIALSPEVRNFKGGFILENKGIEINNTFEALAASMRDQLENEVVRVLF